MLILLKIGGTAWAGIAAIALILILTAAGAIRKMYPEKKSKPWKKYKILYSRYSHNESQ